jgi:hypothetical protein
MTQLQICSSPSAGPLAAAESETLKTESLETDGAQADSPEAESEDRDEVRSLDAIDRCVKVWHRTFDLASTDPEDEKLSLFDKDDDFAWKQAAKSFRSAMPPLAGYDNIRDFIACITYAMLHGVFGGDECQQLFGAAKVAMALLRTQPRS